MAKLTYLEFLENCPFHGLFTSKREVIQFMASDEIKIHRLYHEIRYAKATLSNVLQASPLFKL